MLSELDALIILTTIPHLGSVKIRALVKHFGSALTALNADAAEIAKLPDFGYRIMDGWQKWRNDRSWEKNLELAERLHADIIPYTSPIYPKRLLEVPDHPILLYLKGKFIPADQQCIAVIGTRNASIYGREMAERISGDLAAAGFTVVSGLARGIDTAAHGGALKKGRTIAVIGSGLANIYPHENIELAQCISECGALVSEFPMATPPDRQNFPQRNRIVSGMTLATVLIEAPVKSGAMITVDRACTYNRKVFALPGRVDNEDFKGNHLLIKNGKALLIENASDIINSFEDLFCGFRQPLAKRTATALLEQEELNFMRQLPNQELALEEILRITNLPVMKVNVIIMSLLLKKAIKEYPGKIYKKILTE
jgi:DNA processing protein